jgi:branched-chain amino acid transport system substrate-binding protein
VFAGAAADFEALRQAWGSAAPRLAFAGDDGSWQPQTGVAGQPVLVVTAFALAKDNAKGQEFAKKYRAATGDDPDVHAAVAYDNVRLVAEALKQGVPEKADKLAEELAKIQDFPGLTGPLSFKGERQLRRPAFVAALDGPTRLPAVLKKIDP